jgi:hypothetical protein
VIRVLRVLALMLGVSWSASAVDPPDEAESWREVRSGWGFDGISWWRP